MKNGTRDLRVNMRNARQPGPTRQYGKTCMINVYKI